MFFSFRKKSEPEYRIPSLEADGWEVLGTDEARALGLGDINELADEERVLIVSETEVNVYCRYRSNYSNELIVKLLSAEIVSREGDTAKATISVCRKPGCSRCENIPFGKNKNTFLMPVNCAVSIRGRKSILCNRDFPELLSSMEAAFNGVIPDPLCSLRTADLDDDSLTRGISQSEYAAARALDTERDWRAVSLNTLVDCPNALTFLTPRATLFYLPSLMTWGLSFHLMENLVSGTRTPWIFESFIYQLSPNFKLPARDLAHHCQWFGFLTPQQRAVVKEYLTLIANEQEGYFADDARSALTNFWGLATEEQERFLHRLEGDDFLVTEKIRDIWEGMRQLSLRLGVETESSDEFKNLEARARKLAADYTPAGSPFGGQLR